MKKSAFALALILGLASMIVLTGCEDDSDDSSIADSGLFITPASATIPALAITNILLSVSNAKGNTSWAVDTAALGSIVVSGDTAIYTSSTNAGINYIHVTDASNNTVTASITHL